MPFFEYVEPKSDDWWFRNNKYLARNKDKWYLPNSQKIFFLKNNDLRAAFTKPMDYQCYVHTWQGIFALFSW